MTHLLDALARNPWIITLIGLLGLKEPRLRIEIGSPEVRRSLIPISLSNQSILSCFFCLSYLPCIQHEFHIDLLGWFRKLLKTRASIKATKITITDVLFYRRLSYNNLDIYVEKEHRLIIYRVGWLLQLPLKTNEASNTKKSLETTWLFQAAVLVLTKKKIIVFSKGFVEIRIFRKEKNGLC
jgi:hypothetical protein